MLQLLAALVKCVYGNSTTTSQNGFSLETMYEMVWSHSEFLPVMCSSHDSQEGLVRVKGEMTMLLCACWHTLILSGVLNTKVCSTEQLVWLLVTVVELEPSVSRSSHVTVLLGAYSATSNLAGDESIALSFLFLFFCLPAYNKVINMLVLSGR